ncbi:MAG: PilW family protein [Panacagrimonas sp.]
MSAFPTRSKKLPAPTRRCGFSLVELMISMAIGLLVLAGVATVFLGSRQTYRTQDSMGQVQESGRFLSYLMVPYVRQAGFLPDPLVQTDPADHFRGNWQQILGSENGFFDEERVTGISDAQPDSDALLVSYAGSPTLLRTCLGGTIGESEIAASVFYISAPDASGVSSLNCGVAVSASAPGPGLQTDALNPIAIQSSQALIYGVQDLQILYGVDTDPADDHSILPGQSGLFPNQYLRANRVEDWTRVVSVRLSLTVVAAEATEGADTAMVQDRRLQRVFSSHVNIRNRLRT